MNTFTMWLESLGLVALNQILPAVILLVIGILVVRIVVKLIQKFLDASKLEKAAHSLIVNLVRALLYLLLGLMIADKLGIDVTGIIALASVLTLTTHPFKTGDYVEVAGKGGVVNEITMTYTKLTTPDNKVISIPNSAVVGGDIINYTVEGSRRVDITVKAAYTEPAQKVIDALVVAGTIDKVLMDPAPFAAISAYCDGAVEYTLRVWTKTEDYWDVFFAVNQNVKNTFDAQGIKAGYPHMHVFMEK